MITKVKWKNYKALGNLELDFTNATGEPYNTIVLAGENGTGKTTVLESISNFLNLETIVPFDYIEYSVGGKSIIFTIVKMMACLIWGSIAENA